jgi:hypothetical protein
MDPCDLEMPMSVTSLQIPPATVPRHTVHPRRVSARTRIVSAPAGAANQNRRGFALVGNIAIGAAVFATIIAILAVRVGVYTAGHLDQPVFRDLAARVFG